MLHVFPLYGVGGVTFSKGVDVLAASLREIPGVEVRPSAQHYAEEAVELAISAVPDTEKVAIIGHSGGAGEATVIARNVDPRKVALVVAFDASFWMYKVPIGYNVRSVISFYTRSFYNPLGVQLMKTLPGWGGLFHSQRAYCKHSEIDDQVDLHKVVIKAVEKLSGSSPG